MYLLLRCNDERKSCHLYFMALKKYEKIQRDSVTIDYSAASCLHEVVLIKLL